MKYEMNIEHITVDQLNGFFVGWPNPPSNERFLDLLKGSFMVALAIENNQVVGFVQAISDGVLSAYIPLLEVLPEYQGKGIGTKLMTLLLDCLKEFYMIDLACDPDKVAYYEKMGFCEGSSMMIRNYGYQSGVIIL